MKEGKIILYPSGRTTLHEKPVAWDKHGNITWLDADKTVNNPNNSTTPLFKLRAEENVYLPNGVNENSKAENNGTKNINPLDNVNTDGLGSDFKINTFDILKKDIPYINNINSINKTEQNKNTLFPNTKQDNNIFTPTFTPTPTPTFNDLLKKSSVLNNNVSIDNQDLIAKNSTFGGVDNGFLNKIKGKRFQDLSDEERLKAIWHFVV